MNDKEKDFETAFNDAYDRWYPWLDEAHTDYKYTIHDPWTATDRTKFRDEHREVLNFNITHRIINMITGYERKNRLALKIGPSEGSDGRVASQYTGVVMPLMENCRGYEILSDAFEKGALITGLNLVEIYLDRQGNIQLARIPYNKFLLDPNFSKRDLSDCKFLIRHEEGILTEDVKTLIPGHDKLIDEYAKQAGGETLPFSAYKGKGREEGTRCNFSAFWERTKKKVIYRGDNITGEISVWSGPRALLKEIMLRFPGRFRMWDDYRETVELSSFVNGLLIEKTPDPNKIDDYPFTGIFGYFYPEFDDQALKLQGTVRLIRDPQREVSKRVSKILDIIDSQVASGYEAEAGALVDPNDIHASGQGKGVWFKEGKIDKARRITAPDIPQGLFQLNRDLQTFVNDIVGVSDALFGKDEFNAQMSGYHLKLRLGAALTALQNLFDNLRFSKKQFCFKLCKFIQANYKPHKIARIINQQPVPQFYTDDLTQYDLTPQEGILTATQQQMFYIELLQAKKEGAPISWKMIFENMGIQMPEKFLKELEANEQREAQANQELMKEKQLLDQMRTAKIQADVGRAQERHANVAEHHADSFLARVKAAKEMQQMDLDRELAIVDRQIELYKAKNANRKEAKTRR